MSLIHPDPASPIELTCWFVDLNRNRDERALTETNEAGGPVLFDVGPEQIKHRNRVRDLAEVYTHEREVTAMLDMVSDMFPSAADPDNHDATFLELGVMRNPGVSRDARRAQHPDLCSVG